MRQLLKEGGGGKVALGGDDNRDLQGGGGRGTERGTGEGERTRGEVEVEGGVNCVVCFLSPALPSLPLPLTPACNSRRSQSPNGQKKGT